MSPMRNLPMVTPSHPIKEPAGQEALEAIAEVLRSRSPFLVKGVLVTVAHAKAVMRVYFALGQVEQIQFLKLPVAELIACSAITIDRAQGRANQRGRIRALFGL